MPKYRRYIDTFKGKKRYAIISKLTEKYGYRCWYCGRLFKNDKEIAIDHIIPISNNGTSDVYNLALACKYCNAHKFYYAADEFLNYLAFIRTGRFECPIAEQINIDSKIKDILKKEFYG